MATDKYVPATDTNGSHDFGIQTSTGGTKGAGSTVGAVTGALMPDPGRATVPGSTSGSVAGLGQQVATGAANAVAGAASGLINDLGLGGGKDPDPTYTGGGGGSRSGSSTSSTPSAAQIAESMMTPEQIAAKEQEMAANRAALSEALNPKPEAVNIDRLGRYDKQPQIDLVNQQLDLAQEQYGKQIDRNMEQQGAALNRALADAQSQYAAQQGQISADEQNALDNAALYAEARGDKGGIGQAQYNRIQNTAAQNRVAVGQAQTKMATDTARQIADLRAAGEFDKADRMLTIAQNRLSELRAIEEAANSYNLTVDQVNTAISEWEAEYARAAQQAYTSTELSLAQITGRWGDGTTTEAAQKETQNTLASLALSLVQSGVDPTKLSSEQMSALQSVYGMTAEEIRALYIKAKK